MDLEVDEGCGNWEPLGDVFYEKIEVYDMDWVDKVIMGNFGKTCVLSISNSRPLRGRLVSPTTTSYLLLI